MLNNDIENDNIIEILYNNNYCSWEISEKAIELYKLRKNLTKFDLDFCCRNDPILVQIYKELGNDFDNNNSRTKIEKILKKYENYYYFEYDTGREYVKIDYTKYKLDTMYNKIKEILQSDNNDNIRINEIDQFISTFVI